MVLYIFFILSVFFFAVRYSEFHAHARRYLIDTVCIYLSKFLAVSYHSKCTLTLATKKLEKIVSILP